VLCHAGRSRDLYQLLSSTGGSSTHATLWGGQRSSDSGSGPAAASSANVTTDESTQVLLHSFTGVEVGGGVHALLIAMLACLCPYHVFYSIQASCKTPFGKLFARLDAVCQACCSCSLAGTCLYLLLLNVYNQPGNESEPLLLS
jgi:hypothetical protein